MEDRRMANSYEKVLNSAGKIVCKVDPLTLTVQIVGKGMETRIIFDAKGSYRVEHTAPAA
jgi:hypothetical protein